MVQGRSLKAYYFIFITSALLAVLLFTNLGNQFLWQDEAENAVIAQNILEYGYPRAFDGNLLVISDIGYRKNYTWIFQPWLQNYVTAASFYVLGKSTFSARFPFVLFAIASFILSFFLAKRLFTNRIANISSALLLACVPFLLMSRQARYYTAVLFLALLLIYYYLDYAEGKRFSEIKIIVTSFLLFNTNFGIFFPLAGALIFHYAFFNFRKERLKNNLAVIFIIFAVTLPVFIFFKGWMHKAPLSWSFVVGNIKFYLRSINKYVAPIRILFLFYAGFVLVKRKFVPWKENNECSKNLWLIAIICFFTISFMGAAKFRSLRYVLYLVPLIIILESYILDRWFRRNKTLPVICIAILITTNFFNTVLTDTILSTSSKAVVWLDSKYFGFSKQNTATRYIFEKIQEKSVEDPGPRSYLTDYLYEITHDYDGPIECIVRYLNKNAKKNDAVMTPYGDCALAFYTELKVDNRMHSEKYVYPEWIIPRQYWIPQDFYNSSYFKEIQKKYDKIVLNCPDLRWENRPDDLGCHNFRTVTDYPHKVTIYKKR